MLKSIKENKFISWLLASFITVVLLYFLFKNISLSEVYSAIKKINLNYLLLAFILHISAYAFRTLRFYESLDKQEISFLRLFSVHSIHNFYNHLLPAGGGDATFPFLLKKYSKKDLKFGTALIIHSRLLDLIIFMFLLILGLVFLNDSIRYEFQKYRIFLLILFSAIVLTGFMMVLFARKSEKYFLDKNNKYLKIISSIIGSFNSLSDRSKLPKVVVYSILSNLFIIGMFWALINGMDVKLTYFEIAFASTLFLPFYVLPIRGVAGFGTLESGWTFSLYAMNVSQSTGLIVSFSMHIAMLATTFILFLFAIIEININKIRHHK